MNGIVGHKGKIGSLLLQRANFVSIPIEDISAPQLYYQNKDFEVVVNLAAMSGVDECEKHYEDAVRTNVRGLANLHWVFGNNVLNISSDHVFSGKGWLLPTEKTNPSPVNGYGFTKLGAEGVSRALGGKTLRLSRTVSVHDSDISAYLYLIKWGKPAYIPNFQTRNYLHRYFAVDGIEYLVNNWGIQNQLINYAGTDNVSMVQLMKLFAKEIGLDTTLVRERGTEESGHAPRPAKGGLNVKLAKKLGFPMYSIKDTVSELVKEFNGYTPTYPGL